jgi:PAS domain S-box-containing protein
MKKKMNEAHKNKKISQYPANLRKRTEKALRKSEKYFKEIIEKFSDIIIVADKSGNIKYCSLSIERFTGYKPEEIIGKNAFTFIHQDDLKRAADDFSKAILADENALIPNAFRIVHKNGSEIYLDGLGRNLLGNSEIAGFVMNVRDITESKKTEEKYKNIIENIQEGYFEVDLAGNFTFLNDSMCLIHGYPKKELIGLNNRQYTDKEVAKKVFQAFNQVYKTGKSRKEIGWQIIRKDGTKRDIEASISLRKDSSGKPIGFRGIVRDITERKQAESQREAALEKVRESEENYRQLFDSIPTGIYRIDYRNGRFLKANDVCCEYYGSSQEEITSLSAYDVLTEESKKLFLERVEKISQGVKVPDTVEYELTNKKGRRLCLQLHTKNIYDKKGHAVAADVVAHDITERKLAEEKLRESEANYRQLFDNAPSGIYQIDFKNGKFLKANDVTCEYLGYSHEEITSLSAFDILTEESKKRFLERLEKMALGIEVLEAVEYDVVNKKGSLVHVQLNAKNIYNNEGHAVASNVVAHDITERKKMENALRYERDLSNAIIDSLPGLFYVVDENLRFLRWNDSYMGMLGYSEEEIRDMLSTDFRNESDRSPRLEKIRRVFLLGEHVAETDIIAKDGTVRTFLFSSKVMQYEGRPCLVGTGVDITDKKRTEEELKRFAENLEDANIALRVLMNNRNEDQKQIEEKLGSDSF